MNNPFRLKNAALLMALASIYPLHVHGATGIAQFAVGDVNVRRGAAMTPLNRGQQIQSGDNIITGRAGQTQIRFSDGGLVSLAPNSQFNIDKYADDNKPEEDGFFASFLRGGMRAITGLVGKRNRDNYKITTTTATIGIRGSAFSANYNTDGSINVAGEQDGIVVCTNAGCVELIVGESVTVTGSDSLPVRTTDRSNVPPLVARQDLFAPEGPTLVQLVAIPEDALINGVLTGVSAMFAFNGASLDTGPRGGSHPSDGEGTFVNGLMVKHVGTPSSNVNLTAAVSAGQATVEKTSSEPGIFGTVGAAQDPAFAGWGYWDAGSITYDSSQLAPQPVASVSGSNFSDGVHYIVGRPSPQSTVPTTGTANYMLIGGTAPTALDDGILRIGTLVGAGLNVDFTAGRVNSFVNTAFTVNGQSVPVQISGYGVVSGTNFYSDNYGNGIYYGDSGSFHGFFIGMVYGGSDDNLGSVNGSAVFLNSGAGQAFTQQAGMSALFAAADDVLFDFYPRGGVDPSIASGYFVGNQLYLHDDGEDSNGYGGISTYIATSSLVSSSGSIGNAADTDFIGWGYWAKGQETRPYSGSSALVGVHYLVGRPTPNAQMPTSGTATYSMVGGTAPTATSNGISIMGRLLGATMAVDFTLNNVEATINTEFQKNGVAVPVSIHDTSMFLSGAALVCGTNMRGFFTGNQATRAGLVYSKDNVTDLGLVRGAVALQRGPIAAAPLVQGQ
jgi:hypothetical protein